MLSRSAITKPNSGKCSHRLLTNSRPRNTLTAPFTTPLTSSYASKRAGRARLFIHSASQEPDTGVRNQSSQSQPSTAFKPTEDTRSPGPNRRDAAEGTSLGTGADATQFQNTGRTGSSRKTSTGAVQPAKSKPRSGFGFAVENFAIEAGELLRQGLSRPPLPEGVRDLTLTNAQILEEEESRPKVPTTPVTEFLYISLCRLLDAIYEDKPVQRFWFLEVVARSPYFSYVSVIHLFESLGWWRAAELRKLHFAEEWNEMHHLLIMEALGGNAAWVDRFMAFHSVIAYYWALVVLYIIRPELSYNFSHLLEYHAVDTYGAFLRVNEAKLRELPAPEIAVQYYKTGDLYLFDSFQTRARPEDPVVLRRPPCDSLYDTFRNICDDEWEHVKTMKSCEEWCRGGMSPTEMLNASYGLDEEGLALQNTADGKEGTAPRRQAWEGFARDVNNQNQG